MIHLGIKLPGNSASLAAFSLKQDCLQDRVGNSDVLTTILDQPSAGQDTERQGQHHLQCGQALSVHPALLRGIEMCLSGRHAALW